MIAGRRGWVMVAALMPLDLGKSLKLIAARLGHANETLVLATYGHLQAADDRDAAEELWEVTRRLHGTSQDAAG